MLERNSFLLQLCLMIMLMITIKALPVAEPVEQEQEIAAGTADSGRVVYDQRQEGKYNIHVSIKDVAIIDMDNNQVEEDIYDDGEYYYDDGDLTVKPLILNPTTNKAIINANTTTPIIYTTLYQKNIKSNTDVNNLSLLTTLLNTEEYPTTTTTLTSAITTRLINEDVESTQQISKENKTKNSYAAHNRENSRQTPESPIYRFEVSPQHQQNLQKTLEEFREKQEQHKKQEQQFLKAFEKPIQFQTKQTSLKQQQQQQKQHVRYPIPMHQLMQNNHHQQQHQRQSLCDLTGNCQTRRGTSSSSSSTSATAIL